MKRPINLPHLVQLRLSDEQAKRVDDWRREQTDIPTRSEAIRRLLEAGLTAKSDSPASRSNRRDR